MSAHQPHAARPVTASSGSSKQQGAASLFDEEVERKHNEFALAKHRRRSWRQEQLATFEREREEMKRKQDNLRQHCHQLSNGQLQQNLRQAAAAEAELAAVQQQLAEANERAQEKAEEAGHWEDSFRMIKQKHDEAQWEKTSLRQELAREREQMKRQLDAALQQAQQHEQKVLKQEEDATTARLREEAARKHAERAEARLDEVLTQQEGKMTRNRLAAGQRRPNSEDQAQQPGGGARAHGKTSPIPRQGQIFEQQQQQLQQEPSRKLHHQEDPLHNQQQLRGH
ncbi:hypothetical protein DUNSADRAFT_9835 [Dunaliella salina]|uniref:Uncharacterized protein n=1 Tax=Dunaliella salina TaxID=3046 RepID=A0ABQ7GGJ8_DUNSA|nr:hypothetical protein DUNSADRAFT_9835 [Dunaliella salina]|eukprot:KAF5833728.1 hypothetical protein DUNSADRAFT_9835 [Dunaliella salina]